MAGEGQPTSQMESNLGDLKSQSSKTLSDGIRGGFHVPVLVVGLHGSLIVLFTLMGWVRQT